MIYKVTPCQAHKRGSWNYLQHCCVCGIFVFCSAMLRKINWDILGISASVLCAIHCAVLPLLLASLPVLGINILHNASFEYGMIALAFLVGSLALLHGFRRHHRHPGPWLLFTAGVVVFFC